MALGYFDPAIGDDVAGDMIRNALAFCRAVVVDDDIEGAVLLFNSRRGAGAGILLSLLMICARAPRYADWWEKYEPRRAARLHS